MTSRRSARSVEEDGMPTPRPRKVQRGTEIRFPIDVERQSYLFSLNVLVFHSCSVNLRCGRSPFRRGNVQYPFGALIGMRLTTRRPDQYRRPSGNLESSNSIVVYSLRPGVPILPGPSLKCRFYSLWPRPEFQDSSHGVQVDVVLAITFPRVL